MLFALFDELNWRKFTLVYEDALMSPFRTLIRNYVDSHPDSKYVMKEEKYASPGSAACGTTSTRCGNHVMAEIIRSTKDGTRSKSPIICFRTRSWASLLTSEILDSLSVYVIIGNVSDLSRFGFALAAMGLTGRNEYKVIYISTEHFIDDFNQLLQGGSSPASVWYR